MSWILDGNLIRNRIFTYAFPLIEYAKVVRVKTICFVKIRTFDTSQNAGFADFVG